MTTYNNPVPVVVGLIRCGAGLVAVQRAVELSLGQWAFPGGYINQGETAEDAICREVFEETGYLIEPEVWFPVRTSITSNNQLLIFMIAEDDLDVESIDLFVPNDEATAVKIVTSEDELCFPLHTAILQEPLAWM